MKCPKCNKRLLTRDTRATKLGVRRRRVCPNQKCNYRFTTIELDYSIWKQVRADSCRFALLQGVIRGD